MFNFFRKHLRERFFNRILLTYTVIIACSLIAVSLTILHSITTSLNNDIVNSNQQVVQDVLNYVNIKEDKVKLILQQLYLDQDPFSGITDLSGVFRYLENADPSYTKNYYSDLQAINKYLQAGALIDTDITDLLLLKDNDPIPRYLSKRSSISDSTLNPEIKSLSNYINPEFYGVKLVPTSPLNRKDVNQDGQKNEIFSFATIIRSGDFSKNIGIMLINFSNKSIISSYDSQNQKIAHTVMIFTDQGQVVFDSSGTYYDKPFPYFNLLKISSSTVPTTTTTSDFIANARQSENEGYVIASIVPQEEISKGIIPIRNTILVIMFICLFLAISLSGVCMSVFSRRIKVINQAMGKIKNGDLTARIEIDKNRDEISLISLNFNAMCDNLEDFISKVYISSLKQKDAELKQRSAELYALQSQVNPHFLYNTLESIRMRAISSGNEEVSKMIRILATLFRNSIKQDMIVSIRDELSYCKNYLELFNIRYGEKLEVSFEVDDVIMDYGIMKHLLQPLIENAIVHGIDMDRTNTIYITGSKVNEEIQINITDNGNGIPQDRLDKIKMLLDSDEITTKNDSVGIVNVHQRIRLIFGKPYGVDIQSEESRGTEVNIRLPAKTKGELAQDVQSNAG